MKRYWLLLLLSLSFFQTPLWAADDSSVDWNALQKTSDAIDKEMADFQQPFYFKTVSETELHNRYKAFKKMRLDFLDQANEFAKKYPDNEHCAMALYWGLDVVLKGRSKVSEGSSVADRQAAVDGINKKMPVILAAKDLSTKQKLHALGTQSEILLSLHQGLTLSLTQIQGVLDSFKAQLSQLKSSESPTRSTDHKLDEDFYNVAAFAKECTSADLYRRFLDECSKMNSPEVAKMAQGDLLQLDLIGSEFPLAFTAFDGTKTDLKDYQNKVVLLDFWATWCGPCLKSLPNLKALYAKYKDKGLAVIGISLDKDRQVLTKFIAKGPLPWPTYFDGKGAENEIVQKYAVKFIPQIWVINKGKVAAVDWSEEQIEQKLPGLLSVN